MTREDKIKKQIIETVPLLNTVYYLGLSLKEKIRFEKTTSNRLKMAL